MHRFWFFPLVLGLVGMFLPSLAALEILLAIVRVSGLSNLWDLVFRAWEATALYGCLAGVLLGVGAAFWDRIRNRSGYASRLLLNLWWCGIYTLVLALLNSMLLWFILKQQAGNLNASLPAGILVRVLPALVIMVVNFVGVVWATARTVATEDVLSPRILMSKLRRSALVEG